MSLSLVTLILDLHDGAGKPVTRGKATLVPSAVLSDAADHVLVTQQGVTAYFTAATPATASLIATDNAAITQSGWAWTVTFTGMDAPPPPLTFALPYANGAVQYYSALVPAEPVMQMAAYLPLPSGTPAPGCVPVASGAGSQTTWAPQSGTHYTQGFTSSASVTVTHNLGRFPAITVIDTADDVCVGDVLYVDLNTARLTFSAPFTGTAICT
jgi:hypothetical protein